MWNNVKFKNYRRYLDVKVKVYRKWKFKEGSAMKIEKEVVDVFKTEAVKKWIENDSYAIGIYDIENCKIN